MGFAEGTSVPVEKTRGEIERLVQSRGADAWRSEQDGRKASIMFRVKGTAVCFRLTLPDPADKRFWHDKGRYHRRTQAQHDGAYAGEVRRLWRCLLLAIKAKFEVVDSGIASFEEEFLPHVIVGGQATMADVLVPQLAGIARGDAPTFQLPANAGHAPSRGGVIDAEFDESR